MTFRPDRLETFHTLFRDTASRIRAAPGCRRLELWEDARFPNILTTYSYWTDGDALDAYRGSDLFQTTWAKTKPLFAAPPFARSQFQIARIES